MNKDATTISLRTGGVSDKGRVRENNEDSFLMVDFTTGKNLTQGHITPSSGFLLMVADGMGGHEAGEVASRMAVDIVSQHVSTHITGRRLPSRRRFVDILREAVIRANAEIYAAGRADPRRNGMGTTLTAAGIYDSTAFFAQVGDSRAYAVRAPLVAQMTRDQNLAAELAAASLGVSARQGEMPLQNVLLQALGAEPEITVPVSFLELRRGDWILVCSDGLTGLVGDEEIGDLLFRAGNPQAACHTLVETANARGGRDNITVVTAHCNGPSLPEPRAGEKLSAREFFLPWWYPVTRLFRQ
jgi:PPM family protein phosphatase